MKVLLVHNYYGSEAPSGENVVFEAEKALLEQYGHTVRVFTRHSDEIRSQGALGAVRGAAAVAWNPFAAAALRRLVDDFQPDVVHAHNTFPLISPSVFHAVGRRAARVLTLHNYRLLCPAAIPMREGKVCTDCIRQRSVLPALQHGCYRGSRLATVPLATNVALHRGIGTWQHQVDAFIALSDFQRNLMADGGLPKDKIHVKPNFYAGSPVVQPYAERPGYVVFVGRLGEEKGVRTLLRAWQAWGQSAPELRLVGDGPLYGELQAQATGLPVRFLGQVAAEEAQRQIAHADLLVLPSECFEGFPMVVREAYAFGTPVAVSDLGPLRGIVDHGVNGVIFGAGDAGALLETVQGALRDPAALAAMAAGARQAFELLYNEQANYERLMEIYRQAVDVNRGVMQ
ncbi:group 1 glycosyl transferase [Alcanivorax sp. 521-1]|uniref:Group 1 glycosyl transferase n=1 Tax=Alloalcanivorax profundimaris TaxID=2735259 RepID=A0ABS0APM1_9GAMM|nr:glycosyltransferase family 4 protein [Alloalcanivorax profundimaris]MBF5056069.1 group 1 glycosyl transferase [Alloalcanivorax profundimaris]